MRNLFSFSEGYRLLKNKITNNKITKDKLKDILWHKTFWDASTELVNKSLLLTELWHFEIQRQPTRMEIRNTTISLTRTISAKLQDYDLY